MHSTYWFPLSIATGWWKVSEKVVARLCVCETMQYRPQQGELTSNLQRDSDSFLINIGIPPPAFDS
jgi:hypothetical protein